MALLRFGGFSNGTGCCCGDCPVTILNCAKGVRIKIKQGGNTIAQGDTNTLITVQTFPFLIQAWGVTLQIPTPGTYTIEASVYDAWLDQYVVVSTESKSLACKGTYVAATSGGAYACCNVPMEDRRLIPKRLYMTIGAQASIILNAVLGAAGGPTQGLILRWDTTGDFLGYTHQDVVNIHYAIPITCEHTTGTNRGTLNLSCIGGGITNALGMAVTYYYANGVFLNCGDDCFLLDFASEIGAFVFNCFGVAVTVTGTLGLTTHLEGTMPTTGPCSANLHPCPVPRGGEGILVTS